MKAERDGSVGKEKKSGRRLRITVVYDNRLSPSAGATLSHGWGFSSLVEVEGEGSVLFDTGKEAASLLNNLKRLDKALTRIQAVVISHDHIDHTGGVAGLLKARAAAGAKEPVKVYLPQGVSSSLLGRIKAGGGEGVVVKPGAGALTSVTPWVQVTGPLGGRIAEQAAVVSTAQGPVVLTGCAHPRIEEMASQIKKRLGGGPLHGLVGGLHLKDDGVGRWRQVVKALATAGVEFVAAGHCTGEGAQRYLRGALGARFVSIGSGKVFRFEAAPGREAP